MLCRDFPAEYNSGHLDDSINVSKDYLQKNTVE